MRPESGAPGVLEFRIHGMDCADEVAILKRELIPIVKDEDRLAFDILFAILAVETSRSR